MHQKYAHPRHPDQLRGTTWTYLGADPGPRHWEVESVSPRAGEATLRAALAPAARLTIAWRALRDRASWRPGWHSVAESK